MGQNRARRHINRNISKGMLVEVYLYNTTIHINLPNSSMLHMIIIMGTQFRYSLRFFRQQVIQIGLMEVLHFFKSSLDVPVRAY